jgi:RNA-directed DNA polymerase
MHTEESQMIGSLQPSAPQAAGVPWHSIDWKRCRRIVASLQARIVKAQKAGKHHKVKALQWLLTHSFSGKALSVRRVTENRGKKTPGVDGVLWDSPEKKQRAMTQLSRRGYHASPSKRVYIPKPNGKRRPLGIPTMRDRAMQALHLLSLDPIAETVADTHSYGFRVARSCADAIAQCHIVLAGKHRPEYVFEADIRGCFDHISHDWLLTHIPMDRAVLHAWLNAGILEQQQFSPTEEGTPQGGIISPVLMNLTLDGLQEMLTQLGVKRDRHGRVVANPHKLNLVRYADDFIITGASREVLEQHVKPRVVAFLAARGLTLSEEKTTITHVADGFDFLGQHLQKYRGKVLITPAKKNIKAFLTTVREVIKTSSSVKAATLIQQLNSKIRGWANYHRHISAKRTFSRVDAAIQCALWRWAKRRHRAKSATWIRKRYWKSVGGRQSVFAEKLDDRLIPLRKASDTPIRRHRKIEHRRNPYAQEDREYFAQRRRSQMQRTLTPGRWSIWRQQDGLCPVCHEPITEDREWELHHQDGNHTNNRLTNLVFVHGNCHRLVTVEV